MGKAVVEFEGAVETNATNAHAARVRIEYNPSHVVALPYCPLCLSSPR